MYLMNREDIGQYLLLLEIFFTIVFSIEYALRVACLRKPRKFMLSMLGVVDLCALVPSYLGTYSSAFYISPPSIPNN